MATNRYVNLATAISMYLFVTLAVANRAGFLAASVVSVVATLSMEYYFAPPLFSFRVDRPENWLALSTFEGVSLIVSRLSHRVRRHQLTLEKQSAEQKALYELSRDVLLLDWKQSPEFQLCMLIKNGFPIEGVALWNAHEGILSKCGHTPAANETVKAIYFNERNYDDASHRTSYRILYFGIRPVGALVLYGHSLDALSINSIASTVAMAIERTRSMASEMTVETERQSEHLRSALLDGLAHAFKTPLTTIALSSSGLLATETLNAQQTDLVNLIEQEANRLNELTVRFLRMSQIEPSRHSLRETRTDTQNLLQRVFEECSVQLKSRNPVLSIDSEVAKIRCDLEVLVLALVQLVDNAAKYGSQDSDITVSAVRQDSQAILRIHNEGSYIPPLERQKVFTRFYRSPSTNHRAPGTGLGLSVAVKAVEAHGGKIFVESDVATGTTFVVSLPIEMENA